MNLNQITKAVEIFLKNEDFSGYASWNETPYFLVTFGSIFLGNTVDVSFGDFVSKTDADPKEKLVMAKGLNISLKELLPEAVCFETSFGFSLANVKDNFEGEFIIVTVIAPIEISPYMANRIMLAIKTGKWPL